MCGNIVTHHDRVEAENNDKPNDSWRSNEIDCVRNRKEEHDWCANEQDTIDNSILNTVMVRSGEGDQLPKSSVVWGGQAEELGVTNKLHSREQAYG